MKLADAAVAELYNVDRVIGEEPKTHGEGNFLRMENPYSLSDEGPESMFKQAGGSRRKRQRSKRIYRKRRLTRRRGRRHH